MEYQKIMNLLDNTPNQPTKFRTKNWIEINGDSRGMYNTNSQIEFKTSKLTSSLCDYNGAYILVRETITITGAGADDAANRLDERNKGVLFKNCEIDNIRKDNAKHIDFVIQTYNLIEYSNNYSETSGSLWQ